MKNITVPFEKLDPLREILKEAQTLEKEEHRTNLRVKDRSWAQKMADKAGIILSDAEEEEETARMKKKKNDIKEKKKQLKKVKKGAKCRKRGIWELEANMPAKRQEGTFI